MNASLVTHWTQESSKMKLNGLVWCANLLECSVQTMVKTVQHDTHMYISIYIYTISALVWFKLRLLS